MKLDKVILLASIIGIFSWLFTDFLIQRANRLAAGNGLSILDAASHLYAIAILLLWMALLVISFFSNKTESHLAIFLIAIFLVLGVLSMAGAYAEQVNAENPYARVSSGSGMWLMIFVTAVVMMQALKKVNSLVKVAMISVLCISLAGIVASGRLNSLSIMREFANRNEKFVDELLVHIQLAFASVGISAAIGIPLGILVFKKRILEKSCFSILNIFQTIPSLALFGLLMAPLAYFAANFEWLQKIGLQGIGWAPAVVALTIYALLPVVRNTYTGLLTIDSNVKEAAIGMGMTDSQVLWRVEIPLSISVILSGVRIAVIQSIGLTAVAALIGAGGFGVFIFQGLGQAAEDLVLLGALPTIFLAVATDFIMQGLITLSKPRGQ